MCLKNSIVQIRETHSDFRRQPALRLQHTTGTCIHFTWVSLSSLSFFSFRLSFHSIDVHSVLHLISSIEHSRGVTFILFSLSRSVLSFHPISLTLITLSRHLKNRKEQRRRREMRKRTLSSRICILSIFPHPSCIHCHSKTSRMRKQIKNVP